MLEPERTTPPKQIGVIVLQQQRADRITCREGCRSVNLPHNPPNNRRLKITGSCTGFHKGKRRRKLPRLGTVLQK
jgi:hypothetical protein